MTAIRNLDDFQALDPFFGHWRDYLDPLAVFDAIGRPVPATGP